MSEIAFNQPTELPIDPANNQHILADYQTPEQLAPELGVRVHTLATWRMQQKGPPYTVVGRKIFYQRHSTREWLASQKRTPDAAIRRGSYGVGTNGTATSPAKRAR